MASLTNLQKRYQRSLENEDYYGAEQACRMMHHRLTQSKTSTDDDKKKALEVLFNGSKALLGKSQVQAGAALALMITKHYVDYTVMLSEETVSALIDLSQAFSPEGVPALSVEGHREHLRFLKTAVSWSSRQDVAGFRHGHARLNALAAHAAAKTENYDVSFRFFTHSDDPTGAATVLFEYASRQTLSSEKSLVLTRAVLNYLVSENIADAVIVRRRFAQLAGWRSVADDMTTSGRDDVPPLANFCELVVKICQLESSASTLFTRLCDVYRLELNRDPSFAQQLTKIGQMYFQIQPPQPAGLAGMMGTMLRGMMNN